MNVLTIPTLAKAIRDGRPFLGMSAGTFFPRWVL